MNKKNTHDEMIFAITGEKNPVFNILLAGFLSGSDSEREIALPENAAAFGYLTRGEIEIAASGTTFKVAEKEIFFINAAASSALKLKASPNAAGYWFSADGTLPTALADAYSIPTVMIRNADANGIMISMKDLLTRTNSENYDENMKRMSRHFFDFLLEFAFSDVAAPVAASKKKVSEAERIKTYIDNTIYSDISLDDVKNHFGITKMHAIRVFKAKYSMTPMQYAIGRRADIAASLLVSTDLPIKTISDMLHYSNTQHFSNTFKKLIGTSPNKYRTEAKKNSEK